jgi:hypothetical protein
VEARIKQFELRFLNRLDDVVAVRVYVAAEDLRALAEAERLCADHKIEVWESGRTIARVKKGDSQLAR